MTVENANAFLDELKANGPNAKLMSKIGKDFQPEHMQEALKAKGALEDYQGANVDFSKAIEIDPQFFPAYRDRGIVKELIGDLKGACADWNKASSLGDEDPAEWVKKQC